MSKMKRVGISMDMTPMVDVAFLLLTFFMLTTQFRQPETVAVTLPSSHAKIRVPMSNVMLLTIDKEGQPWIRADVSDRSLPGAETDVAVDSSDLQNVFQQLRANNPSLVTTVKADKTTPFGPVEDAMAALKAAGITRFNFITELEK